MVQFLLSFETHAVVHRRAGCALKKFDHINSIVKPSAHGGPFIIIYNLSSYP